MKLRIKTYYGKLIKRGGRGYKSALKWYNSGTPKVIIRSTTIEDEAFQLVTDDFGEIALVYYYREVIAGFRFISNDTTSDIEASIDDGSCSCDIHTHFILGFEYFNAEYTESIMELRRKQRAMEREKRRQAIKEEKVLASLSKSWWCDLPQIQYTTN